MSPILTVQRRMMELGRCRLGTKGPKGEPRKLDTFRWTSASRTLLEAIAESDGGTVQEWADAPDEGYFEIITERNAVDIIIPPVFSAEDGRPTAPYSQFFEQWSAGGCQRRCDGLTDALSGKPCLCAAKVEAEGEEKRECKVTTRFSFMRPDIPGLGVWRLESHGWNSAVELPGTLEVMLLAAAENKFIPAVLRIEHRTKKVPGEPTRKFIVPVIDLPGVTVNQLVSGDIPLAINAPVARPDRPALPAGPPPPDDPKFNGEGTAAHGAPPPLPDASAAQGPADAAMEPHGEGADTGSASDKLTARLMTAAETLGVLDATKSMIDRNRKEHVDEPGKHTAWLRRQVKTAEENVALRAAEAESPFKAPDGALA